MATDPFEPDALVLDGRFRIVRHLGSGGMGEVYLAEQVSLRRKVALKVLRQDADTAPEAVERFRREALLLSSVEHPAVVRVIDFGQSGGAPCLVMELVEGDPLDFVLHEGPLPPERVVPLLAQLAEGLAAIHEKGIVHRDLKPDNVILVQGPRGEQARLLDFGIARLVEPDPASGVTQANIVLGTPEYLSPEQALGQPVDGRSDLYSLGVLAFRLLSGRLPFEGPSPRELLAQHVVQPPPRLDDLVPALREYPALCALVMWLLEKDRALRPRSAQDLARELSSPGMLRRVPRTEELPAVAPAAAGTDSAASRTLAFGAPTPSPAPSAAARTETPATSAPTTVQAPLPAVGSSAPNPAGALRRSGEHPRPNLTGSASPVKTQNLTVMLTDIAGFTERTSRQTREENARMMREHDRILLPLLRGSGGKVVQKRGDALLVTFKSPTESVLCGMAMQDALWRYNSTQPEAERIPVRVALHLGEVLIEKETVLGEPVKVVEAVEAVAPPGEVVFTEAVRLSMNKAEVPHEERGAVDLPGRNEQIRLYRCIAAAEGIPFGGRDANVKRSFTDELRRSGEMAVVEKLQPAVDAALGKAGAGVRKLGRRGIAALVVLFLLLAQAALIYTVWYNAPSRQVRRFLAAGDAARALKIAEGVCINGCHGQVRSLYAAALHASKKHKDELAVLGALRDEDMAKLDPLAVAALAEDLGRSERDAQVGAQLGRLPAGKTVEMLKELASGPASFSQWGAARYLDTSKGAKPDELADYYAGALGLEDCRVRGAAARRLGELGAGSAKPALSKLAATPKKPGGLLGGENCGQDEASAALRKLEKN